MQKNFLIALLLLSISAVEAQQPQNLRYRLISNIPYVAATDSDTYRRERCKLDVYYPENSGAKVPVLIWFHGGGLEGGNKFIPKELRERGIAIVAPNYRLSPQVVNPAYTHDAAKAIAWVFNNIEKYGGDKSHVYVAGHSAGGYLSLMATFDRQYLQEEAIDADQLRGIISVSGQTNTHYTIRAERKLPKDIPIIDRYAPINRVRESMPPVLLITGDRDLEMLARYEENEHLYAILKSLQGNSVELYELPGFDHGTVLVPAYELIMRFINKHSRNNQK